MDTNNAESSVSLLPTKEFHESPAQSSNDSKCETNKVKSGEVCRVCLCNDRKLCEISPQNLANFSEFITKIDDSWKGEPLPQQVCCECHTKMTSFTAFKTKASQSHRLLSSLALPFININAPLPAATATSSDDLRCELITPRSPQPEIYFEDSVLPSGLRRFSFRVLLRRDAE